MAYNILIIDDSSIVRKSLIKTFSMTDIAVDTIYQAENGQVGLDTMKGHWIDVVMLDINMPIMNGMEFMKNMVSNADFGKTPVIVVSTEGSKERIDELNSMGVRAYLRKPVTPEQLAETLTSVLGESKNE